MTNQEIAQLRLRAQRIACPEAGSPADLLSYLGAIQAQDYPGALWSIGLRLPGLTRADVEQAIADRTIVRTWPMRGTLHFVAATDVRWMLTLLGPKVIAASAGRNKQLGLDEATFLQSREHITRALQGNAILTRNELFDLLEREGISTAGQRGIHIVRRLCLDQVLCFGPYRGKQPTFVLLDEWVTARKELAREEALQVLTERYFISHGPATLQDFAGWSGLTLTDAKVGVTLAGTALQKVVIEQKEYWMSVNGEMPEPESARAYLLPGFDEFMLGYKDRSAALSPIYADRICPGSNGMFLPTLVIDGQVCGTWRSSMRAHACTIEPRPFFALQEAQKTAVELPAHTYAQFLGVPVTVLCP